MVKGALKIDFDEKHMKWIFKGLIKQNLHSNWLELFTETRPNFIL